MSYRKLLFAILFLLAIDSYASVVTVSTHVHDMEFRDLARKWDEAIPLGNATIGSLIWQKGERLRMSIDRSDLWDLRHSKELEGEGFSFHWLYEQLQKGDYRYRGGLIIHITLIPALQKFRVRVWSFQ